MRRRLAGLSVALVLGCGAAEPSRPVYLPPAAESPLMRAMNQIRGGAREEGIAALAAGWGAFTPAERDQALAAIDEVTQIHGPPGLGAPGALEVWTRALADGTGPQMRRALAGLRTVRAADLEDVEMAALRRVLDEPALDRVEQERPGRDENGKPVPAFVEGQLRAELCEALGELRSTKAVPLILEALERSPPTSPARVHRAAVRALGQIRDASAVDAVLLAPFRVESIPDSIDLMALAKQALAAIGEPAVPRTIEVLQRTYAPANKLAEAAGYEPSMLTWFAADALGWIGRTSATAALVAAMPQDDCRKGTPWDEESDIYQERSIFAAALGRIGDPAAAASLCLCSRTSKISLDMVAIAEALGRIGGAEAFACLAEVARRGEYVVTEDQAESVRHEIRGDAARHAVLAAAPGDVPALRKAFKRAPVGEADRGLQAIFAKLEWGVLQLEGCKGDRACYLRTVSDAQADRFAREKAAYELARMAPGDEEVALAIARLFAVRDQELRVSAAILVPRVLGDRRCPACAQALADVLAGESGRPDEDAEQAARVAIARVGE